MDDELAKASDSASARLGQAIDLTRAEGSADVVLETTYDMAPGVPDEDAPMPSRAAVRQHGVVDFATERARLIGDATVVFDGPVTHTQQSDGRWTHQRGEAGQLSSLHPCWALAALRQARAVAEAPNSEFTVELDHEALDRLSFPGVAAEWSLVRATVRLDDAGRVGAIEIRISGPTTADEPSPWIRTTVEFTTFRAEITDIGLPEHSVDLKEHLGLE